MVTPAQKVICITGATDGLGKTVAMELARQGARLLLHGRNPEKGKALLKEITALSGHDRHRYYNADLASLGAVHAMCEKVLSENDRLDILINNAGIGTGQPDEQRQHGEDGYERKFAVNYLSHFLLTHRLLPLLQQSAPARIINVASGAQRAIDFNDVMLEKDYAGSRAYAQSKLALVMFTFDLAGRLKDTGITVNCLHPASLMNTNMVRRSGEPVRSSVEEGADTVLYVALSPEVENVTGAFFDHHQEKRAAAQAYDSAAREQLRALSTRLVQQAGLSM